MKKLLDSMTGKILIILLCPVIVIALCSVAIVTTVNNMDTTEAPVDEETEPAVVKLEEDTEAIAAQLGGMLVSLQENEFAKLTTETHLTVESLELGNEAAAEILRTLINRKTDEAKPEIGILPCDYGEDDSGLLSILPTTAPVSHTTDDSRSDVVAVTLIYGADAIEEKSFAEAEKSVLGYYESGFSATPAQLTLSEVRFVVTIDRNTQQIVSVEKQLDITIDDTLSFSGNLISFGEKEVKADILWTEKYYISTAGVIMNTKTKYFSKGDYDSVDITANMAEGVGDDEFTLEFRSSDESVATVDENGQVTAVCEEGTAEITAVLTYLGREFISGPCVINVSESN